MDIVDMTRKDFESLPYRKRNDMIICDSIVILPTRRKHDSGFRCMDFVAVVRNEPKCLLSGMSDVLHLDGIGGNGFNWLKKYGKVPEVIPPSGWSIDCLPKSGLLRVFALNGHKIICGSALSSFEIYAVSEGEARSLMAQNLRAKLENKHYDW